MCVHDCPRMYKAACIIHDLLTITPWNLTKNYVTCHLQNTGILNLSVRLPCYTCCQSISIPPLLLSLYFGCVLPMRSPRMRTIWGIHQAGVRLTHSCRMLASECVHVCSACCARVPCVCAVHGPLVCVCCARVTCVCCARVPCVCMCCAWVPCVCMLCRVLAGGGGVWITPLPTHTHISLIVCWGYLCMLTTFDP